MSANIVSVGSGSYTTERPASIKALPETIYRADPLKGPVSTNQWWSSLVWKQYSQPLFTHPLALKFSESGLSITYPGQGLVGSDNAIMGAGVDGDLTISQVGAKTYTDARLADKSDWFITAETRSEDTILRASFGHGSPFVYFSHHLGTPEIECKVAPEIWAGKQGDATLGISVRGRHYGLFGPSGSSWINSEGNILTLETTKNYFSVALLPDRDPATLQRFSECAHRHVINTRVRYKVNNGYIETRYEMKLQTMEGECGDSLMALYPHQWKYSSGISLLGSYRSVRGEMKLISAQSFETRVPSQGLLPHLPAAGIPDRAVMRMHLAKVPPSSLSEIKDTYWEGKDLGRRATLAGIAEAMGEDQLRAEYLEELEERLEQWLTATIGGKEPLFYYDEKWGSLIGARPSYGSDDQLNDHHFHYGYFIRAAAEVARNDPEWAAKWGPMVEHLIRDIASTERDDPMFPYLRCFDLYAGHSWASGHADFADGNNQESSSESLNAWYSMVLWGEVTGNDAIRDTGLFLFNTERTAIEEYWFDVSGSNYPESFPETALGMLWGGKGAFATWFSGEIDCIHGINWLPFTPASLYMGRYPEYVRRNHDRVIEVRKAGHNYKTGWGDLVAMFGALADPTAATNYIDTNPNCKVEAGNTHAFMYHWCHTLDRLGRVQASVTADHPFYAVFEKDGRLTRVVYNFSEEAIEVRFSDGVRLKAQPLRGTIYED